MKFIDIIINIIIINKYEAYSYTSVATNNSQLNVLRIPCHKLFDVLNCFGVVLSFLIIKLCLKIKKLHWNKPRIQNNFHANSYDSIICLFNWYFKENVSICIESQIKCWGTRCCLVGVKMEIIEITDLNFNRFESSIWKSYIRKFWLWTISLRELELKFKLTVNWFNLEILIHCNGWQQLKFKR